ncbi:MULTISPECIES: hypothetical protein [unclassified Vibrio]|uniref:hypothetical protein n=1 Tax=unclassified Vibrio TaxID=2614977 RepID=UPI001268311E|nr:MULTISPECIES: hypothetical protein [unclassified Vibrio]QFT40021.1 hypothetical protein FIU99_26895 [Vibrio sp. THAF64]QGM37966.1 hypothetical protein GGC04_27100 [Vibrio sp. THAF191d]QGN73453.1 hypothetical protein GGC03_27070 [Vibrio sp. THAF191c]
MLTIRHRWNAGSLPLNEDGLLFGYSVIGNNIPALLKDGELAYKPYLGTLDNVYLLNVKRVKLVNLNGYTHDKDGLVDWQLIPVDHYLVGVYRNGGYYILTKDREPIIHPL